MKDGQPHSFRVAMTSIMTMLFKVAIYKDI